MCLSAAKLVQIKTRCPPGWFPTVLVSFLEWNGESSKENSELETVKVPEQVNSQLNSVTPGLIQDVSALGDKSVHS